ncbi:hypothetical protein G210_3142, partial [Candida maltosa Xu316]
MGFISTLLLIATVYPVIASCRAFEDYTRVTNTLASQNLKIGGFTVPLNYIYGKSDATKINADDERALQIHLISIQKWFIYWIVTAIVSLAENVLFFKYIIPGYSLIRLAFNIWLIIPMISIRQEVDANSTFDNTVEWKKFTSNGAGLIYFNYIKPWIEQHIESIRKLSANPANAIQLLGFVNKLNKDTESSNESSSGSDYSNVLDSFVMVMNMKNKWTGGSTEDVNEQKAEEFDVVDATPDPKTQATKRKGYFW